MALDWASFFAPANLLGGYSTTDPTDTDDWPFVNGTAVETNTISNGASTTVTHRFDLSGAPGAKKGFRMWGRFFSAQAEGFSIDEIRLVDVNGPTTLFTDSAPPWDIIGSQAIQTYDFPDSAFSGNPNLNQLRIEFDITNLRTGNNVFGCAGIRFSKSPFEVAEEVEPPPSLAGADFAAFRAADVLAIGAVDNESMVVIPDSSGKGRHTLFFVGTVGEITVEEDTIPYFNLPTAHDSRFIWKFAQNAIAENTLIVMRAYPTAINSDHPVVTGINAGVLQGVAGAGSPGSKIVWGWSGSEYVLMSGDGSGPAHLVGGSPATNTWAWSGTWTQISGNEHAWEDDNTTPIIDGASGANTLHGGSLFHHESSNRQGEGRIAELWLISVPAASYDETDMTDAMSAFVNGYGFDPDNLLANLVGANVELTWDPSI